MIFTERTIKISNDVCKIDDPIVLYRGDYNVEVRFTIIESPFKYTAKNSTNIIEAVDASYGQLVIKVPNDGSPIFSDVVETKGGSVVFTLSRGMIDESIEVGDYTFQIRLFDANKESRATIPPVENGISIREPIAFEDVTTTNKVGEATVGYALTTAATPEDAFDSQGNYNKTTWETGDRITNAKLNKIEAGIDSINKKANNIPTRTSQLENDSDYATITQVNQAIDNAQLGGGGSNINDTAASATTTYSSNKIENIKDNLSSQINNIAKKTIIEDNKLYLVKSDGTKLDEGTQLPVNSSSSVITNKFYKTESIGQLYDQPGENNYIAWCPGDLRYDKNLDKYIMLAYCRDKHVNATIQEVYQIIIDPYTYETSKPVKIKMLDTDGNTDITPVKFGCCSYIILNDGTYLMINQIDNVCYKFTSTDNGLTWIKQNTVTGYSGNPWGMYELSNGRIIISDDVANVGLWYSDDKGDTWTNVKPSGTPGNYNAEGCILELGNSKLMCIARKNMTGSGGYAPNNNNYSGASEHAIISYSNDNGATWTAWQESNSIDNMNASCCTGIVHDNIVEIFACSRWYISQNYENTDHANTGKCGAITHYTATIDNALNDNFTNKGIVIYSNAVGTGSSQDFHSPCLSKDKNDNILLVYFDRIGNGIEEKTNHYFIRGTLDAFDYSVKDDLNSNIFTYSSNYINKLLSVQKAQLITLINQAINGGGTVVDPDNPDAPTFYITDNLVCNFNFLDESKMDKENMTVTDTVNKIVGTFSTSDNNNVLVTTFPTVNKNYMEKSFFRLGGDVLNKYITDTNYEYSVELGVYFESKNDLNKNMGYMIYKVDGGGGDSSRIYCNMIHLLYDTNSTQKNHKPITSLDLLNVNNPVFYHIVVTYSNTGVVNAYSNGSLIITYNVEDFKNWHSSNIQNTSWFIQPKRFMRIYKKVLTQDEILNNYKYEKSLII